MMGEWRCMSGVSKSWIRPNLVWTFSYLLDLPYVCARMDVYGCATRTIPYSTVRAADQFLPKTGYIYSPT